MNFSKDEKFKFYKEIVNMLEELSDEEIISLANTVTGGLLKNKITTRPGAVEAIINHSDDVQSILKRKAITREKLLSYCYKNKIPVKLPITKLEIIDFILKWLNETFEERNFSKECKNENIKLNSNESANECSAAVSSPCNELIESQNSIIQQANVENNYLCERNQQFEFLNPLAEQFSKWFYELLNGNKLTPEHFYPNASLNLILFSNNESESNSIANDPSAITKSLLSTKIQYDLFFNANLSNDSIKVEMDSYGLVILLVFGTLHSKSICVGVFEQMFALARDPSAENNWKIKRTDLKLKSGETSQICDNSKKIQN